MNFFHYKLFLLFFFFSLVSVSCKKEYESIEVLDEQNIQAYLQQNNLDMEKHASGFYYKVLSLGNGQAANDSSKIFITHSLRTFNRSYISEDEKRNRTNNYLGYFATGYFPNDIGKQYPFPVSWYTAIKEALIKKGGAIRLVIPSRLAYGRDGHPTITQIEGNQPIDCTLNLYDVSNNTEFEDVFVKRYIQENNIAGLTRTKSGLYYEIITPGSGDTISANSEITVAYKGRLTDGTVFEETESHTFDFTNVDIEGWRQGVPLIKKGGKIRLIIPPALAYGGGSLSGKIKANEILDFEIELKDIKDE